MVAVGVLEYSVTIVLDNGSTLPEYTPKYPSQFYSTPFAHCVEAIPGRQFAIRIQRLEPAREFENGTCCHVFCDGKKMATVVLGKHEEEWMVDGKLGRGHVVAPFRFSEARYEGDEGAMPNLFLLEHTGIIKVCFHECYISDPQVGPGDALLEPVVAQSAEKVQLRVIQKLQLTNLIGLGTPRPVPIPTHHVVIESISPERGRALFRYRSAPLLAQHGIKLLPLPAPNPLLSRPSLSPSPPLGIRVPFPFYHPGEEQPLNPPVSNYALNRQLPPVPPHLVALGQIERDVAIIHEEMDRWKKLGNDAPAVLRRVASGPSSRRRVVAYKRATAVVSKKSSVVKKNSVPKKSSVSEKRTGPSKPRRVDSRTLEEREKEARERGMKEALRKEKERKREERREHARWDEMEIIQEGFEMLEERENELEQQRREDASQREKEASWREKVALREVVQWTPKWKRDQAREQVRLEEVERSKARSEALEVKKKEVEQQRRREAAQKEVIQREREERREEQRLEEIETIKARLAKLEERVDGGEGKGKGKESHWSSDDEVFEGGEGKGKGKESHWESHWSSDDEVFEGGEGKGKGKESHWESHWSSDDEVVIVAGSSRSSPHHSTMEWAESGTPLSDYFEKKRLKALRKEEKRIKMKQVITIDSSEPEAEDRDEVMVLESSDDDVVVLKDGERGRKRVEMMELEEETEREPRKEVGGGNRQMVPVVLTLVDDD